MRTHTHQFQRQTHFSTMIVIRKRRIVADIEIQHIENNCVAWFGKNFFWFKLSQGRGGLVELKWRIFGVWRKNLGKHHKSLSDKKGGKKLVNFWSSLLVLRLCSVLAGEQSFSILHFPIKKEWMARVVNTKISNSIPPTASFHAPIPPSPTTTTHHHHQYHQHRLHQPTTPAFALMTMLCTSPNDTRWYRSGGHPRSGDISG